MGMKPSKRRITDEDFLIERPFGDISRNIFGEWFDAAYIFVNAKEQYTDEVNFIAAVNGCFHSLARHSTRYDDHISGGRAGVYETARALGAAKEKALKTRAFLLLEQMFQGFTYNQYPLLEKADVTREQIRIPSPLLFIRRLLTSEDYLASEAYAHAVVRAEIFAATARSFPPSTTQNLYEYIAEQIDYKSIGDTLKTMASYSDKRESTNITKPIHFIVGHYLASLGLAKISLSRAPLARGPSRNEYRLFSVNEFLSGKTLDILPKKSTNRRDDYGYEIKLTVSPSDLPSIPQILNDLEGIPFPVPGAKTVFAGGIRLTEHGGAVVRISGKSGSGKTSLALAACVGLAPLGTETFYLSCEEERDDLLDRISTVTPAFIRKNRAFSSKSVEGASGKSSENSGGTADYKNAWFHTYHLDSNDTQSNFEDALSFVDQIMEQYGAEQSDRPRYRAPGTVPYVVVLDGVHELVDRDAHERLLHEPQECEQASSSPISELHRLIEKYRKLNVLVILVSADFDTPVFNSLDYLVDVVVNLDNNQDSEAPHKPLRSASLTKTRRQFSNTGTHKFHISKRDGVRFYPNLEATVEQFKSRNWQQPDSNFVFDFLLCQNPSLKIFNKSHTVIAGKGSGGKAGFALRLLTSPLTPREERTLSFMDTNNAGPICPARRCLIISFLYPESYYSGLVSKIKQSKFSDSATNYSRPDFNFSTLTFYPGYLAPEVLLTKIADELRAAELQGYPFDSVLLDGLHNVFLQFPLLEKSTLIWPMLSEMFRRLGVNVVTTHSHFEVLGMGGAPLLSADVMSVAHRSTPLLQALINSADYYLDVSSAYDHDQVKKRSDRDNLYEVKVATAFGQAVPRSSVAFWDREAMQIKDLTKFI
ncbi:RAD55 family ATPase [Rhodobacter lacus]|uniref:RAD55 family ATPase n=1 Tax=Rhodobacter lacus TaxID=1641972 RepID=A0ABW5A985_9RHOB